MAFYCTLYPQEMLEFQSQNLYNLFGSKCVSLSHKKALVVRDSDEMGFGTAP
jgi:hypothetical protein